MQCRAAIRNAERAAGIPTQLMAAIARVESGRTGPDGVINPWPWSINVEGVDHIYDTKAEVIAAVQAFQVRGIRSIDVGCMQVNLMYHPNAFASLDEAFDPVGNAAYGAKFLTQLYEQTRDWTKATAWYHSGNPELGEPYQRKVAAVLPDELKRASDTPAMVAAATRNVWSTNAFTSNVWNTRGAAFPSPSGALKPANALLASSGTPLRPAGGGFMLNNGVNNARLLPAAAGTAGRGLDAYRATPISVAYRQPIRPPS